MEIKRSFMFLAALLAVTFQACEKTGPTPPPEGNVYDRVVILYSAGMNSLSIDLQGNIAELAGTAPNLSLPQGGGKDAFIIIAHHSIGSSRFDVPTSPYIIRLRRDLLGRPVRDTLKTLEPGTDMTDPEQIRSSLDWVRNNFQARHYGLIMSSHGSGWLPEGYYARPEGNGSEMLSAPASVSSSSTGRPPHMAVEVSEELDRFRKIDGVKSFGEERRIVDGREVAYETDIRSLAGCLPMHFDYIIFDACLMGGIEVAYELKDKTDYIAFSPAEILSGGFAYGTMMERLLGPSDTDLQGACEDYFNKYAKRVSNCYATISLVDCSHLEELASVCRRLFDEYRWEIGNLDPSEVQGFFRMDRHYFYDLEDILKVAGATREDIRGLDETLDKCIPYKAWTSRFFNFDIRTYCGLSMYLPAIGTATLDSYYRTLGWNKASGLVE